MDVLLNSGWFRSVHPLVLCGGLGVAAVLTGFAARADAPSSAEDFFRPAPAPDPALPADALYPRGRLFPFGYYSVGGGNPEVLNGPLPEEQIQADLRRVRADHATLLGLQYELNHRALSDARDHGYPGVLYEVGLPKPDVVAGAVPAEVIRERIAEQVRAVMDDERLAWWYLAPSELRHWRRAEMEYVAVAAETIRQTDPRKRPIFTYEPNHRSAAGMAHITRHLDFAAKGMYVNYTSMKDQRVWCRWTIEQQREAIAQANPDAVPIAVPEMFQQPPDEELERIPAWVRHDVYCALTAGAKGVLVFSHRRRPTFEAHETYYQAYRHIAHELCGDLDLGQVFLFGEKRDDLAVQVTEGPKTVEMVFPSGGVREPMEYPSVSVANLAYGTDRYLFLVNSAKEAVRVEISGLPTQGLTMADAFDETALPAGAGAATLSLALDPLGVRGLRFSPR